LALRLADQSRGDAGPAVGSRDVDLLDLVVDDHDEPGYGFVDGRDRRVRGTLRSPCPERCLATNVHELLRNEAEMAVPPTVLPDLGDVTCILVPRGAKRDL
jgi:hypothetical protein